MLANPVRVDAVICIVTAILDLEDFLHCRLRGR